MSLFAAKMCSLKEQIMFVNGQKILEEYPKRKESFNIREVLN